MLARVTYAGARASRSLSAMPVRAAEVLIMPSLSPTMTEGTVTEWKVAEGDIVEEGDVILNMETDKTVVPLEALDTVRVAKIIMDDGASGTLGSPIAVTVEEDEEWKGVDFSSIIAEAAVGGAAPATASSPKAPSTPEPTNAPIPVPTPVVASTPEVSAVTVEAWPSVQRLLAVNKVDATRVALRSGGRLTKADVISAVDAGLSGTAGKPVSAADAPSTPSTPAAAAVAPAGSDDPAGAYTDVPASGMRKVISKRLVESKTTIPHEYVRQAARIDALLAHRKNLASLGVKASVNDFIVRAVGLALKDVPAANCTVVDGVKVPAENSDVAVAVATPTGLITPIVRAAEQKQVGSIGAEMKELAGRARTGNLRPNEFQGGSFTVSNLGMFGIPHFTAIINPPHAGIMAVGAGTATALPKIVDGQVVGTEKGTVLNVALSLDARAVDVSTGQELLSAWKKYIENPQLM